MSSRWVPRRTTESPSRKERRTFASALCSTRSRISTQMALGDLWNRTLVYFGIAEEDEWDDDYAATEELERSYEERRANVRRLSPRKRDDPDDWTEAPQREEPRPTRLRRVDTAAPAGPAPASVHLVIPR